MHAKILAAVTAILIAAGLVARADQPAQHKLTGDMVKLQYLIGAWSCTTKLPAADKMPARKVKGTTQFYIGPSNTVEFYLESDGYASSGFLGLAPDKKTGLLSGADVFGGTTMESGERSGGSYQMAGTSAYQGQSTLVRETVTKLSDKKYRDLFESRKNGQWTLGADSTCTKTSDKPM
jgi:hypothetical protein